MDEGLLETLPLAHRLALSYSPKQARRATLALFALDERLAKIVSSGSEPMISQLKLAWWRDRFSQSPDEWPDGEPLLSALRGWPGDLELLKPLVDGWEAMLDERFDRATLDQFVQGKEQAWSSLADGLGAVSHGQGLAQAVQEIALFELANNLSSQEEIAIVKARIGSRVSKRPKLDRRMRPIAVLHALARRAEAKGNRDLLANPGAMTTAIRVGITGR